VTRRRLSAAANAVAVAVAVAVVGVVPACSQSAPSAMAGSGGAGAGAGMTTGQSGTTAPATCSGVRAPAAFDTFKIADAAPTGARPSIVIGPDATPIVAFRVGAAGREQVVAARLDNPADASGPRVQMVPLSYAGPVVTSPRVAARDGRILSAYSAESPDGSHHGRYDAWSGGIDDPPVDVQPIDDPIDYAAPAIAIDATGRPVMAFLYLDFSLRLLTQSQDGAWSREVVAIGVIPFASTLIDMTLDSRGRAVLVGSAIASTGYAAGQNMFLPPTDGLTVWRYSSSGWITDRLLSGSFSLSSRIRLSPSGEPTIFYSGPTGGLARATLRDEAWRPDDPVGGSGAGAPLGDLADVVYGPQGEIQVVSLAFEGLTHGVFDGCRWSKTVVTEIAGAPAIAVDGEGRVHIAYERQVGVVEATGSEISEVWYARPRP
jgi:hypothetical protein